VKATTVKSAATKAAAKAEPTKAEPTKAEPTNAEPSKAEPTNAEPTKAEPTKAATKTATKATKASKAQSTDQHDDHLQGKTPAAGARPDEGASMAKTADSKTTTKAGRSPRSAAETEKIRAALAERRDELKAEYDHTLDEIAELQRDRLTDSAGDDQADTGTKTLEREQEISLANGILERITQVERALERLDEGSYGWCEKCGNPIPVERLAAFPSATLCVTCKQLEERR
jgi:DnaK suppressor protein